MIPLHQIINLDPTFTPFGYHSVPFQKIDFPSGCEPHIKIQYPLNHEGSISVTYRIQKTEDIVFLMIAIDALQRMKPKYIHLFLPYLPFARQDRLMVTGEPLSIKVMANILNSLKLDSVCLYDVHSEVGEALIDNCMVSSNLNFVNEVLKDKKDYLIVSPDSGAYKKIFHLCQGLQYRDEIVLCNKTRNTTNGKITSVTCSVSDFNGKDLYIVDDICDGGYTFVLLAEELRKRNSGKINLIVSHGIFSKGIGALDGIDHIYTTDSFQTLESTNKLTQIKLCTTLI